MKTFRLLLCLSLIVGGVPWASAQVAKPEAKQNASRARQNSGKAKAASGDDAAANRLIAAGARSEIYKTTVDSKGRAVELKIFIFDPADHQPDEPKPAIVFFFGGGWRSGSPTQFIEHCKYLARRGMVAMTADYRVFERHRTRPTACVSDGKSALRWIRENAARLGVDPNKVAAGGGSAGGHVAACTGIIKTLDEPTENSAVSSKPDALVLFNPALVLAPIEGAPKISRHLEKKLAQLEKRIGADPATISPAHSISQDEPPTIIFHGEADKTVPYATAELFKQRMQQAGNSCELVGYPGEGHGFFNAHKKKGKYTQTVAEMDRFLVGLDFLRPKGK